MKKTLSLPPSILFLLPSPFSGAVRVGEGGFPSGPKGWGWVQVILSLQQQGWVRGLTEARGKVTSPATEILPKAAEQSQC